MAAKARCIITHSEPGRDARGVRVDNDENVWFSPGIAEAAKLDEGDEVDVVVVKNEFPNIPWKAIRVWDIDDERKG